MKPDRPSRVKVKDPNDIARTTIKETNIHDSARLNMKPDRPSRVKVKDPNDIARITTKETTLQETSKLNMKPNKPSNIQVKDKKDVPKITTKETSIHEAHKLNMKPDKANNSILKDPDDIAKITTKETTQLEDYLYNPKETIDTGYIAKNNTIEAYTTHRETTTTDYTGDAKGENTGGYEIAEPDIKNTVRQFTSDYEYEGIAGPSTENKPLSYEDIYNSTIRSVRQEISKGRIPSTQGPKNSLSGSDMNISTNKNTDETNKAVDKRGVYSTKVYSVKNNLNNCSKTVNKNTLPNQDRLDPTMVSAFKENPYTQSLHSHVFP